MRLRFYHKIFAFFIILFSYNQIITGQSGTQNSKFVWDQSSPDLATANTYQYAYYETTARVPFTSVICTGTVSPFVCSVNIPAFTPGAHTIQLTAAVTGSNPLVESTKSLPFTFTFIVIPGTPANIRIQ